MLKESSQSDVRIVGAKEVCAHVFDCVCNGSVAPQQSAAEASIVKLDMDLVGLFGNVFWGHDEKRTPEGFHTHTHTHTWCFAIILFYSVTMLQMFQTPVISWIWNFIQLWPHCSSFQLWGEKGNRFFAGIKRKLRSLEARLKTPDHIPGIQEDGWWSVWLTATGGCCCCCCSHFS